MLQVDKLTFSPDSQLVAAAGYKAGLVLVFSVQEHEWRARVEAGLGGLAGVAWGGDSRHLATLAEWSAVLTVWSLAASPEAATVQYIRSPKPWVCSRPLHNRDLTYSCVVERRDCRDCLNIFTADWALVRHALLDTEDCAGAAWSPAADMVAVWDSPLYYRVQVSTQQSYFSFIILCSLQAKQFKLNNCLE